MAGEAKVDVEEFEHEQTVTDNTPINEIDDALADAEKNDIGDVTDDEKAEHAAQAEKEAADKVAADEAEKQVAIKAAEEKGGEKDWKHQAFHEERERRKDLQIQLDGERTKREENERRMGIIEEKLKGGRADVPDFEENPAENLAARTERLELEAEARKTTAEATEALTKEQTEKAQQYKTFYDNFAVVETGFIKDNPDYYDAIAYLKADFVKDKLASGYSEAQAEQAALSETHNIVTNGLQQGFNAADRFYTLAKSKGYVKGKVEGGEGKTELEKLKLVEKGIKNNTSLGTTGGGAGETTLSSLLKMDDSDFDKATESDDDWEKLVGKS